MTTSSSKPKCTCNSFILQYEGGCQCEAGLWKPPVKPEPKRYHFARDSFGAGRMFQMKEGEYVKWEEAYEYFKS